MKLNELELTILVRGRPIIEYQHQGQIFVEGRAGSEYEIEVRNHTYRRVEAVLSVDGLSVLDGKPAGAQSRGYLINPRDVIRIPGWLVDSQSVAKFSFAGAPQSYAAQSSNETRNNGVIGAMVFAEKIKPPVLYPMYPGLQNNWTATSPTIGSPLRGFAPATNMSWGNVSSSAGGIGAGTGMGAGGSSVNDLISGAGATAQCYNAISQGVGPEVTVNADFIEQSLGTAFGAASQFATHTVAFERGDQLVTLLCYYDEKRGLKARGIPMPRQPRQKPPVPQAFPAMGCQPPLNWRP